MKMRILLVLMLLCVCIRYSNCKGELKTLDENNWDEMLNGEWMVEFFAPWCPACQQLEKTWKDFAQWSEDLGIKVASADLTVNPGLSGRFMITALPTIFHVKDGVFRQYRGARDKDSFFSFIEEKKYLSLDPVSSWKSPQSHTMSTLAYFFKLSMYLRSVHTTIVEDWGIPYWGSYIFFGFVTILIGTILGLLIVFVLDYVCRGRATENRPDSMLSTDGSEEERRNEEEFEGDDIIGEEWQDDSEVRKRRE